MSEGREQNQNLTIQGIGVSPGVVVGTAHLLQTVAERVVKREVSEEELPRERQRIENALVQTRGQLHHIQQQLSDALDNQKVIIQ